MILPLDHLPGFLADLARVLPASALSDAYRIGLGAPSGDVLPPLVVLAAWVRRGVAARRSGCSAGTDRHVAPALRRGARTKRNPGWSGPGVQGYVDWLRGADSNRRPSGYEPDELPLLHPANATIAQASRDPLEPGRRPSPGQVEDRPAPIARLSTRATNPVRLENQNGRRRSKPASQPAITADRMKPTVPAAPNRPWAVAERPRGLPADTIA